MIDPSEELPGLIREVEWIPDSEGELACRVCRQSVVSGHAPDCRLAAFLKRGTSGVGEEMLALLREHCFTEDGICRDCGKGWRTNDGRTEGCKPDCRLAAFLNPTQEPFQSRVD